MREYFCAYHSMLGGTRKLSDAECGRLFRALLRYSSGTDVELINLQGREEVLFDVYSQQIDRDAEAYEKKCQTNRANASERNRSQANASDGTQDKDKGKDKGKDKDDVLKKRFDNHWRTSTKARAAVAQVIVDAAESGPLGATPYPNLHGYVSNVLASGYDPDTILDAIAGARSWSELAVWLSMHGGVKDDDT